MASRARAALCPHRLLRERRSPAALDPKPTSPIRSSSLRHSRVFRGGGVTPSSKKPETYREGWDGLSRPALSNRRGRERRSMSACISPYGELLVGTTSLAVIFFYYSTPNFLL